MTTAATDPTSPADDFEEQSISKCESLRLKTLAEQTYASSDLKSALKYAKRAHRLCPSLDGLSQLLTAFKILTTANNNISNNNNNNTTTIPHWYKVLDIEPFSNISLIKKQYKKLALVLHPDRNTSVASEDAFKVVNEAFTVLNDKIRKKEYDMRLRIDLQTAVESGGDAVELETFWTLCSGCKLLYEFERRYLGQNLICPSCKRSFEAVEVDYGEKGRTVRTYVTDDDGDEEDEVLCRSELKRKMSSVGDILRRSKHVRKIDESGNEGVSKRTKVRNNKNLKGNGKMVDDDEEMMTLAEMQKLVNDDGCGDGKRLRVVNKAVGKGGKVRNDEKLKEKENEKIMDDDDEEMMTLAEMQKLVNDDDNDGDDDDDDSGDNDDDDNDNDDDETMTLAKMQKHLNGDDDDDEEDEEDEEEEKLTLAEMQNLVKINVNGGKLRVNEKDKAQRSGATSSTSKSKTNGEGKNKDSDIMAVEDSDFYDFDEGRVEKSFKKGQIWALYDDDGMPRHYGLIDEVVSTHPFEVNMSWLDPQINGDDTLLSLERTGFYISCGRFKVSKKTSVISLNVFSHIVNCERAAREVYRIYPKKGSVWALYNDHVERGSQIACDKRRYDIVVFLTSYSEVHGLSMAYLEKVKGFKTTFRRREIGCHAIKWLEKHEAWLFSHQIPARKLSGEEVSNLSGDLWELDPASLPTDLISTNRKK